MADKHILVLVLTHSGTEVSQGYTPANNLHYYVQVYNAGGYVGAGYLNYTNYFRTEKEAIASFKREVANYGGVLSRKTAQNAGVMVEEPN